LTAPEPNFTSRDAASAAARVRRINRRWIVHGRLREHCAAFLAHLCRTDPARHDAACRRALALVRRQPGLVRDPKPLFYAGLFASATPRELDLYLVEHPMTLAICCLLHDDDSALADLPEAARPLARDIATEIRAL
jgi:hypothetical protein